MQKPAQRGFTAWEWASSSKQPGSKTDNQLQPVNNFILPDSQVWLYHSFNQETEVNSPLR